MDPLSITASIAGITGICLQAARALDTLHTKFQNAQVTITALSSQCAAIKTGLSQLQTLILQNHTVRGQADVVHTLDTTLTGCLVVLTCFEDSLEKLCDATALMESRRSLVRTWWTKARIVRNEGEMKGYLSLLQGQQSAIAFLVQVLHMNTTDEILEGVRNGKGLLDRQATKAASLRLANPQLQIAESVLNPRRTADTIFRGDGNTVAEGVEFEFDNTVVNSRAYRRMMALAKEVVTNRTSTKSPQSIMALENISFDSKTQSRSFLVSTSEPSGDRRGDPTAVSPMPSTASEVVQPAPKPTTDTPEEAATQPTTSQSLPTSLDILKAQPTQLGTIHTTEYFGQRCQHLFTTVTQWVLRFSKFSDMRASRLTSEINDENIIDRLDNSVLDGSDADNYLRDRVKRRDMFTSVTMSMIWEFIFTRYLFGMDREQRFKLKSLEKQLTDIGPTATVRAWRATTLGLWSRRESFRKQRDRDAVAVAEAILEALSKVLPPPGNLEEQLRVQLRRVVSEAVNLSIEMRTQVAEFMVLPPLMPEYNENGELAATVNFISSLMTQPGGRGDTEGDLEGAVVRVVLFPLVVQKGDLRGEGEEEVVVFPAQVIVNTT
ncbi:uncharacterized protein PODANS_5_8750 [Podospora anserina S mat+]|uniref:Podospora anserina S mat+ genomic DNA chromosome 5, supercontig 9 n=1 Tax=Podospora anserina (strain S / ATCC MYA-4624 / DSM 980 / FGSC 10383) TaxID=515849 RepID=B2AL52_PODAN|nr:uncharacterized protein PODANS_5_8750 [Podospora anserina S mat+]CAP64600.1 unnamed protein product [Podospora anserina S mat+]CDP29997.1 Putative protein of unknown function [Podospora anserina S mat+]